MYYELETDGRTRRFDIKDVGGLPLAQVWKRSDADHWEVEREVSYGYENGTLTLSFRTAPFGDHRVVVIEG